MPRKLYLISPTAGALCVALLGCESPAPPNAPEQGKAAVDPPGGMPPPPRSWPQDGPWRDYKGVVSAAGQDWLELSPGWQVAGSGRVQPQDTTKPRRLSLA